MHNSKRLSKTDKFLVWVELSSVMAISVSLLLGVVFVGAWILLGFGDPQKARLSKAINGININWKVGLLLLIPLFYRTIRTILERMEKGPLGTEFPILKQSPPEQDAVEETRPATEGSK